jgi:hypothetical protein
MKWKNPRGEITEVQDDETKEKYMVALGYKKVGDVYEIPDTDEVPGPTPEQDEQNIVDG